MTRVLFRPLLSLALALAVGAALPAAAPPVGPDLSEYRTVETAITTRISMAAPPTGAQPAYLGIHVRPGAGGELVVEQVEGGSPAAKAGLQPGDVVVAVAGRKVAQAEELRTALQAKAPGDTVPLAVRRKGRSLEVRPTLAATSRPLPLVSGKGRGRPGGWDTRAGSYFTNNVYNLAVVCIEYPDVKHNPKVSRQAWEEALFSRNRYTKKSVTGEPVFGSLHDYYQEQSHGHLRVQGKVFDYVQVSKKRGEYAEGTGPRTRSALLTEALDKLLARDGAEALKGFDGLFFLYAGASYRTNRGGLYWPHKANVTHKGKRWPYFICPEGGPRMANISVICHEFGHLLGLPDLYARPESPGSEGVGVWCAMSNQAGNGRPQHFCAWSKDKLGWLKPAVLDPTVKQKLILAPVEDSPKQCFKVLIRPDGSEYLLLENRRKKGFDASLPAEGLLIWRVVNNRPILEEAHGVLGPAGPRVHLHAVPYPSEANTAFTPYTTPSSRSQLGGGLPVHITNIRRLPDGRITFHLGYEYL
jgi:M6 family metalloprotease-like protein